MDDNPQPTEATTPEQLLKSLHSLPFPKYQRSKLIKDVKQHIDLHGRVPDQNTLRDMIKSARLLTQRGRADKGKNSHAAMIKAKAKRKTAKKSRQRNRGK